MALEAVSFDDRIGPNPEGVHAGFVYFNDHRRVAYTDEGVQADVTGGWAPVTAEHTRLAKAFLENQGGLLGTRVKKASE